MQSKVLELVLGPKEGFYAFKIACRGIGRAGEKLSNSVTCPRSMISRMQMVMATLTTKYDRKLKPQKLSRLVIGCLFGDPPNEEGDGHFDHHLVYFDHFWAIFAIDLRTTINSS